MKSLGWRVPAGPSNLYRPLQNGTNLIIRFANGNQISTIKERPVLRRYLDGGCAAKNINEFGVGVMLLRYIGRFLVVIVYYKLFKISMDHPIIF
jgi:hypothetical protein